MIKVSVLYPHQEDYRFDMGYYVDQHVAMIRRLVGDALKKVEIERGLAGGMPGSTPPFVAGVHMYFDSVPAYEAAFGPHGSAIRKDVPNYTNIRPTLQISELVAAG